MSIETAQRHRASTAIAVLVLTLLATPGQALVAWINTTGDSGDLAPGDGVCWTGSFVFSGGKLVNECTLRAAIEETNALAGADEIRFLGSLPTTAGFVELSPSTALPPITDPLMIDGYSHPSFDDTARAPIPIVQLLGSATPAGTSGLVVHPSANGSTIRGLALVAFPDAGVVLGGVPAAGPDSVTLQGNHLGVWRGVFQTGNGQDGLRIDGAVGSRIGAVCGATIGCAGRGNLMSANGRDGVRIARGSGNELAGNRIGVDRFGYTTFVPFGGVTSNDGVGIEIAVGASGNTVGGVGTEWDAAEGAFVPVTSGNLVSGHSGSGIRVLGEGNFVWANYVGTNAAGTAALPNAAAGIYVEGSSNTVGGPAERGNLVSGNGTGISVPDLNSPMPTGVVIEGNAIGVNADRDAPIPNGTGIRVGGSGVVVRGNLIAGNTGDGAVTTDWGAEFLANFVGTDGILDLGNGGAGIRVNFDGQVAIGRAGEGNVIGFNDVGIVTGSGEWISIVDNRIGVGPNGEDIGNDTDGVHATGSDIDVGMAGAMAGGDANVIGFNRQAGIRIGGGSEIRVANNYVGTDATGATLGNDGPAIVCASPSSPGLARVGGDVSSLATELGDLGNVLAHNASGIAHTCTTAVPMRGNLAWSNGDIPIDLAADGVTPNDPGDADTGANRLQNTPELLRSGTSYVPATGDLEVAYTVSTALAQATYPLTIDFYLHDPWLRPGEQVGTYVGSDTYDATHAGGVLRSTLVTPLPGSLEPNALGFVFGGLRATATDANGNTSELSTASIPVPEPGFTGSVVACAAWMTWWARRRRASRGGHAP